MLKHTTRGFVLGGLMAMVIAVLPTTAEAARPPSGYQLTEILIDGQPLVQPQGIANNGIIVGFSGDSPSSALGIDPIHGFVLSHGEYTRVDRPGTNHTYLNGVNEAGVAVGFSGAYNQGCCVVGNEGIHGFTWHDGEFTEVLHHLNGGTFNITFAMDINSQDDVTGFSVGGDNIPHGFVSDDGVLETVHGPEGQPTYGSGLTDSGIALIGASNRAQLLRDGVYEEVDLSALPAGAHTISINDVNNRGDLVGAYHDGAGSSHGYVLRNGKVIIVDWPGSPLNRVNGINNRGDIVGEFLWNGTWHGYVGSPH